MASLNVTMNRLEMYYEAEKKILKGQSYTIGSRTLTRANLAEVRKAIEELEEKAETLSGKQRSFAVKAVFRD